MGGVGRASAMHSVSVQQVTAGKTASRKKSIGVRFSAIQSDGRVESDTINAVIGLSP